MLRKRLLPIVAAVAVLAQMASSAQAQTKIYTALGASDVNGVGATNPSTEGYVPLLSQWMSLRAPSGVNFELRTRAVNGFTAPNATTTDVDPVTSGTQTLLGLAAGDAPAVATVWYGVNDALHILSPSQFPNSPYQPLGDANIAGKLTFFSSNYSQIIQTLKGVPNIQIVTANVPKLGAAYLAGLGHVPSQIELNQAAGIDALCGQMSSIIDGVAGAYGVPVVDLYNDSTTFSPSDLAFDGHFNTSGHFKLANLFGRRLQNFTLFDILVTTSGDPVSATDDLLTLREAITLANTRSGTDTIRFHPGLSGNINVESTLTTLSTPMNLQGPGANVLTVRRDSSTSFRLMNVSSTVNISGLTLANGESTSGSGGAINNQGTLTVDDCVFSGNKALGGNGGAIGNSATLNVDDSTFTGNSAELAGGAISNSNSATITSSTISGNEATGNASAAGNGGGIINAGNLFISNSTIDSNTAESFNGTNNGLGGGIYNNGSLEITSSTIRSNTAEGRGGGLLNQSGTATISGSTLSGNAAANFGGQQGGGFYVAGGLVQLTNSTVAKNSAGSGAGFFAAAGGAHIGNSTIADNIAAVSGGAFLNNGADNLVLVHHSIFSLNTAAGITDNFDNASVEFNLIGNDLGLVLGNDSKPLLTDNGGPTETIALTPSSPAINAGDPTYAGGLTTDQRGSGFPRIYGGRLDIGAFEAQTLPPVAANLTYLIDPTKPFTVKLGGTDFEGAALTFDIASNPTLGTLGSINTNSVVYTPGANFLSGGGVDTFTYTASDGGLTSAPATVTLRASAVPVVDSVVPAKFDDSAVGSGGSSVVEEKLKFTVQVTDTDGANQIRMVYLTFNDRQSNAGGAALAYDAASNKMFLRSADGSTILPRFSPLDVVAPVSNGLVELDFENSSVSKAGNVMTLVFAVTPKAGFTGLKRLYASVKDHANVSSDWAEYASWTVKAAQVTPPKFEAVSFTQVIKPGAVNIPVLLKSVNPDGVPLTYTIVQGPNYGSITGPINGVIRYTPNGSFTNSDTVIYKVTDGYSDSANATVTLKYNGAPNADGVPAKSDWSVYGSGGSSAVGEPLNLVMEVWDEDGPNDIRIAYLTFNRVLGNGGGAALSYDLSQNKMFLRSADGSTLLPGYTPGDPLAPNADNGNVILDFSKSSVTNNGTALGVTFHVIPKTGFTGVKKLYVSAKDRSGLSSAWKDAATWTINPAAPPAPLSNLRKFSGASS